MANTGFQKGGGIKHQKFPSPITPFPKKKLQGGWGRLVKSNIQTQYFNSINHSVRDMKCIPFEKLCSKDETLLSIRENILDCKKRK